MPRLLISGYGSSVHLVSEHLEIFPANNDAQQPDTSMIPVPLRDIEDVLIVGTPSISIPVLQELMKRQIPVVFVSEHGHWLGMLDSCSPLNAARRIAQYKLTCDAAVTSCVATKIVHAKIHNARRVLQRLSASRKQTDVPAQIHASSILEHAMRQTASPLPIDSLLGIEGAAAAAYFDRLADFFPAELPFVERSRQPPRNEANALLSWSYTILLSEISTAIRSHGLELGIGFLHSVEYGKPSLALDILELFRAPVCDLLTMHLLNHHILKKEHFLVNSDDQCTYLDDSAKKLFFHAYENAMTRQFSIPSDQHLTDFRHLIQKQINTIIHIINGEKDYDFFLMP